MNKFALILLCTGICTLTSPMTLVGTEDPCFKSVNNKENSSDDDKAEAKAEKSPHTFTGNVSLISDYRFRGISQTMRRPAIQGGFDYAHSSGIYLGTWASNVDGTCHYLNNTSMEWDLYGGYKGKLFPCYLPDFGYNIGIIYYYYPGGRASVPRSVGYDTTEGNLEFSWRWVAIKYSQTFSNYFGVNSANPPTNWEKNKAICPNGSSRGSNYIEVNLTFPMPYVAKTTLLLHGGHQIINPSC